MKTRFCRGESPKSVVQISAREIRARTKLLYCRGRVLTSGPVSMPTNIQERQKNQDHFLYIQLGKVNHDLAQIPQRPTFLSLSVRRWKFWNFIPSNVRDSFNISLRCTIKNEFQFLLLGVIFSSNLKPFFLSRCVRYIFKSKLLTKMSARFHASISSFDNAAFVWDP